MSIKNIIDRDIDIDDISKSLDIEIDEILNDQKNDDEKNILILSGGSTKCAAHVGAIQALKELGFMKNINTIACSSGGGLVGVLTICGYKPKQIMDLLLKIGPDKLKSPNRANIFKEYGIDRGDRFMLIYGKLLEAKGFDRKINFRDFYKKTRKNFIVVGACLNDKKPHYFSKDTFPHMSVLKAIRITISMPGYFTPVLFENKTFIDGGCSDNYPINLFKNKLKNVIGIYLNSKKGYVNKINSLDSVFMNTFDCLMEGLVFSDYKAYSEHTIMIELNIPFAVSLDTNPSELIESFDVGYRTVLKHYDD